MFLSNSRLAALMFTLLLLPVALRPGLHAQETGATPTGAGAGDEHRIAESIEQILRDLSEADDKLPNDFDKLGRLRVLVLQQLPIIQIEIKKKHRTIGTFSKAKKRKIRLEASLENKVNLIAQYRADVKRLEMEIKELQGKLKEKEDINDEKTKNENIERNKTIKSKNKLLSKYRKSLRFHNMRKKYDTESLKRIKEIIKDFGGKEVQILTEIEILQKKHANFLLSRDHIEAKINKSLARDVVTQNFKANVSMVFAGLVFVVIAGFFLIAYRDPGVRRTIFSGDSGIQFLTLFSIVIALILFGITGILGDKELAAILSGIAGYILGRGRGLSNGAADEPPASPRRGGSAPPGPGAPDTPKPSRGRRRATPANTAPQASTA